MKPLASMILSFCILVGCTTVYGQNWTSNSIAFSPIAFSMSADAAIMLVASYYDGGYVSTNGGATWTNTPHSLYVSAPACSADGSKLFVVVTDFNPRLTCSTNFGVSWFTVTTNFPSFSFLTSSADGNTLVGGGSSGLFTSTNAGANWITNYSGAWYSAACSADGSRWIASAANTSVGIVISTNFGVNWTTNSVSRNQVWTSVASSADGNTLIAASSPPRLFVSTNGGGNWTSNSLPDTSNSPRVAVSAHLHKLVVWRTSLSRIYTSSDLGATWVTNNAPNDNWLQVGCSADGNKLLAILSHSFWRSEDNVAPRLNLGRSNNGLRLSWLVPSANCVVEEKMDLNSTNWIAMTNHAEMNFSNLDLELSVPPNENQAYFRLTHQ